MSEEWPTMAERVGEVARRRGYRLTGDQRQRAVEHAVALMAHKRHPITDKAQAALAGLDRMEQDDRRYSHDTGAERVGWA